MSEAFFRRLFDDPETSRFGSGWISGTASVFLATLALGGVLCFRWPELLSAPEVRQAVPVTALRAILQGTLVAAFLLGLLSALLRQRKVLGLTGMALVMLATLLGGAKVEVDGPVASGAYLGLDWFLLNILFTALIFVPLERAAPKRPEQGPFRAAWTTDLAWFFSSHALVQVLSLLILLPASVAASALALPGLQRVVAGLPAVAQFLLIVPVADLTHYAAHRAFHRVPLLWRFHRVHHSVETMDWLAGSRLHLVDVVLTRGLVLVPIALMGFSRGVVFAYLAFVAVHAVFIHANFAPAPRWLEGVVVLPRFHHWHHAADERAVDKNFAVHLPVLDAIFGTRYLPRDAWPERLGLVGDRAPRGFFAQLAWPFRAGRAPDSFKAR